MGTLIGEHLVPASAVVVLQGDVGEHLAQVAHVDALNVPGLGLASFPVFPPPAPSSLLQEVPVRLAVFEDGRVLELHLDAHRRRGQRVVGLVVALVRQLQGDSE